MAPSVHRLLYLLLHRPHVPQPDGFVCGDAGDGAGVRGGDQQQHPASVPGQVGYLRTEDGIEGSLL